MKKVFVGLVMAVAVGLVLLAGTAYAEEVPTPEIQIPEISLEVVVTDVRTAIEVRPVSLVGYFDFGADFVAAFMVRIAKTTKPAYLFNGMLAVQVAVYEQPSFDLVWGISQEGGQYVGVEIKGLPLVAAFLSVFEKAHPIIAYYMGDEGTFTLGICYEFRVEE